MMKLAVRDVNALPCVLKTLAVPAFEIAASDAGTSSPSKPCPVRPPPVMCVVAGAPVIWKTPSTLPSRSVTATVTARFRAAAAETACAITFCTSVTPRLPAVTGFVFGVAVTTGGAGVGIEFASSGGPPPTCPTPTRTRLLDAPR